MSRIVHINKTVSGEAYDIRVEDSFEGLPEAIKSLGFKPYKLCIVTDSNVGALYASALESLLKRLDCEVCVFTFTAGEERKNLGTVTDLYSFLIERHFDRKSALIALGGGVVGDLTGFTAATFLRGIPFIQVPTSLLADTDSSIGGKTGVDLKEYKNMIGAFYMPSLVYINVSALNSLSDRQFSSGMAEIVKHALIRDRDYHEEIKSCAKQLLDRQPGVLEDIIYRSLLIKAAVVEIDPKEQGIRAILNFGHTLGHAIERYMDFRLTHGECVSLGSVAALKISALRSLITEAELEDAAGTLSSFGLPVRFKPDRDTALEEIVEISRSDKKMAAGRVRFILLKAIGEAYIETDVSDKELYEALRYISS